MARKKKSTSKDGDAAGAGGADGQGTAAPEDAAAAFLESIGMSEGAGGEGGAKKKKKKKPKKKAEKKEEAAPKGNSAMAAKARAQLAARQEELERKQREEEERKRQEEEELARIAAEEAAAEAAATAKREAREARNEKLKKEGKYLTKAQRRKQEAARQRMRLLEKTQGGEGNDDDMSTSGASMGHTASVSGSSVGRVRSSKQSGGRRRQKAKSKFDTDRTDAAPSAVGATAVTEGDDKSKAAKAKAEAEEEDVVAALADVALEAGADSNDDWEDEADDAVAEAAAVETPKAADANDDDDDDDWEDEADALVEAEEEAEAETAVETAGARQGTRHEEELDPELKIERSRERRAARMEAALAARSAERLRSPVVAVLGHVDTGKTSLLDKMRRTNVQGGEAGGITQQIGATFFPIDSLRKQVARLNKQRKVSLNVPGMMVIDTPGHESFTNLRTRGSTLCDVAVLVIDIMHGLEPQTIESLNLLQKSGAPFVVALNKVDRCYGWKTCINTPFQEALEQQEKHTVREFHDRVKHTVTQLMERGLNAALYYDNNDPDYIPLVPTSAHTAEGIQDLLLCLLERAQAPDRVERIMWHSEPTCTLIEVKAITGLGTTIDVILMSGSISVGDTIVLCGTQGPIVTTARALLTPGRMKEMRVNGKHVHHDRIEGAMGIKIAAHGVENALAGTPVFIKHAEDAEEDLKDEVTAQLRGLQSLLHKTGQGVFVQASTLGSLEALLEYLRSLKPPIPVAGFSIGPVHKKDVTAASVMLGHREEYATILAFDVTVSTDARNEAEKAGVTIFTADIIYHLFDQFTAHLEGIRKRRRDEASSDAIFPCRLEIMDCITARSPLILAVRVTAGTLRKDTPFAVTRVKEGEETEGEGSARASDVTHTIIGTVASMERENKVVDKCKAGDEVAVRFAPYKGVVTQFGRQVTKKDVLRSRITRTSLNKLKEFFADELDDEDKRLAFELKAFFGIP